MHPLFDAPEMLSSESDEAKLFAKNFSKNFNLEDSGVPLLAFPSRPSLKLRNISVTPKMVEKVIIHQRRLVLIVFDWGFLRTVSLRFHTY